MAKFLFRLEPLLTARRRTEQDARRVVAGIERERLALEEELRRHQREILRHFSSLELRVVDKLNLPQDTGDLWWADSMVVVKAVL